MIAQLGIVFVLSARVEKLAASTAGLLFILYSALTGVTLSFVLLAYTGESVATTFVVTAGMFGGLAVYGTVTKRSLAGLGPLLFMGLIGVVLASIVGIFWQNDALQFVISFVGVIVFTGLAAYDAQRLKEMALALARRTDRLLRDRRRAGALSRFHQPVPVPAPVHRQPARLSRSRQFAAERTPRVHAGQGRSSFHVDVSRRHEGSRSTTINAESAEIAETTPRKRLCVLCSLCG